MKDLLEDFVAKNALCKEAILRYVDDYSIYCFYIGEELELYTKYSSPLRLGDDDPSFSIYYSKYKEDKILFKDQSTGKYGDVFTFLRYLVTGGEELSPLKPVLLQINSDFGLGLADDDVKEFKPKLLKKSPIKKIPTKIEINAFDKPTQEYLDYWGDLEITKPTRDKFYTTNVKVIHYKNENHITIVPRTLTIGYEILGHYKIYCPLGERRFKFRNDYLDIYVEGALQLDFKQDFALITKATKECMFFYEHFGWECVAGKSENTPINPYFMTEVLQKRYKKVFIWLDGDEAGQNAQARYLEQYPWLIPIYFDDFIVQKDPTDLFLSSKKSGKRELALKYLKTRITDKL